ncbi:MAG: cyclic-di-AMP receptor [Chloroflexota bacterium]
MKLVILIVQDYDAPELVREIVKSGLRVTQVASTGGFLRSGNTTLLAGVEDHQVTRLLRQVDRSSSTRTEVIRPSGIADFDEWYPPEKIEVEVGGATVFILDVDRFIRIP